MADGVAARRGRIACACGNSAHASGPQGLQLRILRWVILVGRRQRELRLPWAEAAFTFVVFQLRLTPVLAAID